MNDINSQTSDVEVVCAQFCAKIRSGEWKAGDRLPTARELAKILNCSIGTLGKAVVLLSHEGIIDQRKKAGIRILEGQDVEVNHTQAAYAFIYTSERHEGVRRMVEGFHEAARLKKSRVVTLTTGIDYSKEAEYFRRLSEFDVRGALIHPLFLTPQDQVSFSQMLTTSKFPVVLADVHLPGLCINSVCADNAHASYVMASYLLKQGLKRVGFVANSATSSNVRDKYLGYRQALDEHRMVERPEDVLLKPMMAPSFEDPLGESVALARDYLRKHPDIEGVACSNDFIATGFLIAAQELNWSVPDRLQVTGISGFRCVPPGYPVLTTYRIPFERIGARAFESLATLSAGGELALNELIRGEISVGESTRAISEKRKK